jgi:hypothetical protein
MATSRICSVDGCGKPHHAHGYCAVHAARFARLGDPLAGGMFRSKNNGATCRVDGCTSPSKKRGFCDAHYARWRRHGDPTAGEVRTFHTGCAVNGCQNEHKSFGYCGTHLRRFKLYGDPLGTAPKRDHPTICIVPGCTRPPTGHKDMCHAHYKRFWRHGDADGQRRFYAAPGEPMRWLLANISYTGDDCLHWPYAVEPQSGYAVIGTPKMIASRLMCELVNGPPPTKHHEAAHNCGNGHLGCVNPNHLRWATPASNSFDRWEHGTMVFGEEVHNAKLTVDSVRQIRRLRGVMTQSAIGKMFGVHQGTVSAIQLRQSWSWLD